MMKFQLLIIFAYVAAALVESCNTPEDPPRKGVCKALRECDELIEKWNSRNIARSELISFKCDNHENLFCCPIHRADKNWEEILKQKAPQNKCGRKSEYRILGGKETDVDEFPWTVLLQYENTTDNNRTVFSCGGSLINNRYVITAAHCILSKVNLNLKRVRVGEWKISTSRDCSKRNPSYCAPGVIDIKIAEKIIHPLYVAESDDQSHDIALLKLNKSLKFNNFVQPICLPLDNNLRSKTYIGESLFVAGWGTTETGRSSDVKLKVDIVGRELVECKTAFLSLGRPVKDTHLCFGGYGNGKDSCNGDSGASLMHQNTDAIEPYWYLAGIVSFGDKDCDTSVPGLYTKVGDYLQWISSNL